MRVSSWDDLQREVAVILERLNADTALGLAAAANPLLAVEALGYEIDASVRPEIEARLRFGPKVARRALELVEQMRDQLGRPVDADDGDAVREALRELGLTLREPEATARAHADQRRKAPYAPPRRPLRDEELEPLRDAHPFVGTLLEYRRLAASAPRLAPQRTFDAIRKGDRSLPLTRVTGRLKQQTAPPDRPGGHAGTESGRG